MENVSLLEEFLYTEAIKTYNKDEIQVVNLNTQNVFFLSSTTDFAYIVFGSQFHSVSCRYKVAAILRCLSG